MKNYIKIIVVIGILVGIFGAATVKGWLSTGVDQLDKKVVQPIKNSEQVKNAVDNAKQSIADKVTGKKK